MERPDFLAQLREASAELRETFQDSSAEWLTGIVPDRPSDEPAEKRGVEYIFELLCYFALIRGVKQNVANLRLVRSPEENGFRFPYAPGEKTNLAFFRFEKGNETYDLCAGTTVHPPLSPLTDPDEAPDISLQYIGVDVTADEREPGYVVALWDAKHHGREVLSKADENQILRWCSLFPRTLGEGHDCSDYYRPNDLLEEICPPAFALSGVLTNASETNFSSASAYGFGYSFVFEFDGDTQILPKPSRADHYTHCHLE
jgi:hypothetical protein